jgi:hypothetical protein
MAWPGTTFALDPSSCRAGRALALNWPPRFFPQLLGLALFFYRYGQLEETRPRAIASPPSALSQMPKADENDCRLGRPGGLRTPQVRVFEVYRYRNQNAASDPLKSDALRWL